MIPRPRRRLARRLLRAQMVVIAAGAVTLAVTAAVVGPPLFRLHVNRALGPVTDVVAAHLDEALSTSLALSLGIGIGVATVAALTVSWVLSSRIARPVEALSDAANRLRAGDLRARAPQAVSSDELADLTDEFNDMAAALEHTEDTRRRLLADLAHELRTPLATLDGYLEGLADGVVDPGPATWSILRDAAGRLDRLVDDISTVSRAEEGRLDLDLQTVDVKTVVTDVADAKTGVSRTDEIAVIVDPAPNVPAVIADRHRLTQVLDNLLTNALRHTPAGGTVTVTTRAGADAVTVVVSDTGEGITAEHLPRIFERFYRADPSRSGGGSGIGLTISRAIAHAHGGDLTAASAGAGNGASFTLTVPSAAPSRSETGQLPRRRRPAPATYRGAGAVDPPRGDSSRAATPPTESR